MASEGLARLHNRGVAAPVAQLIGTLEVSELIRVSTGRGMSHYLIAILTRPSAPLPRGQSLDL